MAGIICLRKECLAAHPQEREEKESIWVHHRCDVQGHFHVLYFRLLFVDISCMIFSDFNLSEIGMFPITDGVSWFNWQGIDRH